jgi:hypothetical protein
MEMGTRRKGSSTPKDSVLAWVKIRSMKEVVEVSRIDVVVREGSMGGG